VRKEEHKKVRRCWGRDGGGPGGAFQRRAQKAAVQLTTVHWHS